MAKYNSHFRKLVRNFENATRNHEMKGSMHPDDWEEIEQDFIEAKRKLIKYCEERIFTWY